MTATRTIPGQQPPTPALPLWQIDAFVRMGADGPVPFSGNPAAVMPLERWLPAATMQAIAQENNLAETVFIVPTPDDAGADFAIRWFTPAVEVDLCGHATLAAAHMLIAHGRWTGDAVRFRHGVSGVLGVARAPEGGLTLDFPAVAVTPASTAAAAVRGVLGLQEASIWQAGPDVMAVVDDAALVYSHQPDMGKIAQLTAWRGVMITAREADGIVSRFYAPQSGVPEDHATGSAHCALAPFWASRLGRLTLTATQASPRGATLACTVAGARVQLSGHCVTMIEGRFHLPAQAASNP